MDMGTLKGVIKLIRDNKLTLSEAEIATIMQKVKAHTFIDLTWVAPYS
jgi:hypothetical protein